MPKPKFKFDPSPLRGPTNDSDVARLIRRDGMQKTLEDVLRYLEPLKGEAYIDALHSDVARTLENYNCRYKSGRAK